MRNHLECGHAISIFVFFTSAFWSTQNEIWCVCVCEGVRVCLLKIEWEHNAINTEIHRFSLSNLFPNELKRESNTCATLHFTRNDDGTVIRWCRYKTINGMREKAGKIKYYFVWSARCTENFILIKHFRRKWKMNENDLEFWVANSIGNIYISSVWKRGVAGYSVVGTWFDVIYACWRWFECSMPLKFCLYILLLLLISRHFYFIFFWVRYDSPSQMLIMTRKGAYVYMDDAQIWSHAIYQHLNDFISISVWMRMLFKMWKIIFRFMIVPNEYGERERKKQEKNFIRWWWWWWMKAMKMINERYWWICFNFTKFNCFCLTCYAFEKKYRFVLSTEICSIFFFFSLSVCVCFSKRAHIHIRNKFEKYFVAWIEQKRYKLCRSINSFKFFTHEDTQKATSNLYRKWKQI